MCGIFGIISHKIQDGILEKGTESLAHRGPDDSGYFRDAGIGLGHRRLSIIDLDGGHQPIFNEDASKVIVYNGEIYNYLEIRDQLIKKGHKFQTKSDTETILHAYEEWEEECVEYLRGMFAFAIWDKLEKSLFLARDRLGIKPLFYAEYNGTFYFASEMKAILADSGFPRDMDETGLVSYFTLSYIPAPFTIYQKIKKLLPGHTLTWKDGKHRIRKYWDLEFVPDRGKTEKYFIENILGLLQESVEMRLMSEVPIGAFLSGGIDSSTVVALMSMASQDPVKSFCIGFGGETGGYLDERKYARLVAERYGTDHREYEVMPKPEGIIEKIVKAFDEPFADDSTIPSFFVCKTAKENVTVALSGLGGDEAFAGYERYLGLRLRGIYSWVPEFLRRSIMPSLANRIPERTDGHYTVNHIKRFVRAGTAGEDEAYFNYLSIIDPKIAINLFQDQKMYKRNYEICRDLILSYFNSQNVSPDSGVLNRALYCDLKTYVPDDILAVTDRMSMHHSLEVRVPFLDHKFLELCSTIPPETKMKWFQKKYLIKKVVRKLLPREVINHRKQGFVGPMTQWLKKDLKDYINKTLISESYGKNETINKNAVKRLVDNHFSGKNIHDTPIWGMLVFQSWLKQYN
ncbi:asparagine synthase (glutamine-hydrolyzing) [Thermodesulfobacteriota bacterium]